MIDMSTVFDESKIRRGQPANAGQFASKATNASAATLTAPAPPAPAPRRVTRDDPYWSAVADDFGLNEDERDALDRHLEDGSVEADFTVATTSSRVVADAIHPLMMRAIERQERIDETISANIGAKVGHGRRASDGADMFTVYEGTSTYSLTAVQNPEGQQGFRVNTERYGSAEEIPATYRKARQIAAAFERQRGNIAESLDATRERNDTYERWSLFDRRDS